MSESGLPYIDTNIFLRFLVLDKTNPHLSEKAKTIIKKVKNGKLQVQTNVCIVSELVYILEGYYELSKDDVLEKVVTLLSLENLYLGQKGTIMAAVYVYRDINVDFEDAYTYVLMKEKGVKEIYTFDKKHFSRFKEIEIKD
jgi:predicted nucleic-acid-binding protein